MRHVWFVALAGLLFSSAGRALPTSAPRGEAESRAVSHAPTVAAPLPGWAKTTASGEERVTRWVGSAAFSVGRGEALDPRIAPGGESVSFEADVRIVQAGRYRFGFEAEGGRAAIEVSFGERKARVEPREAGSAAVLGETLELERGSVLVRASFRREGDAECRVRVLWQREAGADAGSGSAAGEGAGAGHGGGAFGPEPILSFFARVPDALRADAEAGENAFQGRMLLARKGCVQCHEAGRAASMVATLQAPRLTGLGERASRAWVERWIRDPGRMKPGSDMPSLYGTGDGDSAAVAQWLTQGAAPEAAATPIANEAFVLERGRKLFHTLGCVPCHGAFDKPSELFGEEHAGEDDEAPPIRFGDLAGKWRPAALAAFLRDPHATRPSGRMPSLSLSEEEADSLANYLLSKWGKGPEASAPGFGETLTLGQCAACHEIEGVQRAKSTAGPLAKLDPTRGCLDPADRATPRYAFVGRELELLRAGLADAQRSAGAVAPHDDARRRVLFLDCGACHTRDGRGGGSEATRAYFATLDEKADLGNEGRIPPDLSGVGFKLTTPWFQEVLDQGSRARPYLATRMPVYGAAVKGLAAEVARCEGVRPDSDVEEPISNDELVQAGRALMGKQALACITCHDFRDFASIGTPGPRIERFSERLRLEWWRAYLRDPSRFKPGTRMPSFESGGMSTCRTILGGNFERQLDALWSYVNLGEFMPAPEGLEKTRGLQLVVGARPIVLRTFLASVGPRAIAVGMPSGVHFAFDAQGARLAEVWRGDFLDASSSWTGRGGENAGGLGPAVWKAPAGPLLVKGAAAAPGAAWPNAAEGTGASGGFHFRGYELGADGVPTFEYDWGGTRVEERVVTEAAPRARIRREFTLHRPPPSFALLVGPGRAQLTQGTALTLASSPALDGLERISIVPQSTSDVCRFTLEIEP